MKVLFNSAISHYRVDPRYAEVSRITLMFGAIAGIYQQSYRPKMIRFTDEEGKRNIVDRMLNNLPKSNGFDMAEIDLPFDLSACPRQNSDGTMIVKV